MVDAAMTTDILHVIDGIDLGQGTINTPDETLVENIRHSIRLGYPQIRPQAPQPERVCLIGGGPSLESTLPELVDLYFAGAKVVTVNGAYQWCIEHNIRPSAQIVLDARAHNAKFVDPAIPQCKYLLASQCHPDTWKRVQGRDDVWIWHAMAADNPNRSVLDDFYAKQWVPTPGGTTVVMRAITILRILGFLRMDLFGVDSCFMGGKHHAYSQPENDVDTVHPTRVFPSGHPDKARVFLCTPEHLAQLQDFLQLIRLNGEKFLLNIHGDGLIAYALSACADVAWTVDAAASQGVSSEGR